MKTKMKIRNVGLALATLFVMMFSVASYSQACPGNNVTVTIANISNTTTPTTTVEFDVYIQNTSANTIKLASLSGAVFHNAGFATTGTFTVVTQPSASEFPGFNPIATSAYSPATSQLRWTNNPVLEGAAIDLPVGGAAKKFARFRFVRTGTPFPQNFAATLTFAEYVQSGVTAVNPNVYCNGNGSSTPLANGSIGPPAINNGYLVVGGPYAFVVNPGPTGSCFDAGSQTATTAPTCAGQSNGTSTVTMTPTPANLNVTYVLDGGSSTPATLTAGGSFTISGLTAGAHTLVVTSADTAGCPTPVTVSTVLVPAGAPLTTNGSVTTSICAGGSYTWPLPDGTGASYTTAQTNLTNTVGCNTATLNLTVNPTTTNGSVTTSICAGGSYTWPLPDGTGATYTTAQTNLTNTVGCNTATLNLTVNPNTTNGSVTTTACGSYTWALPFGTGVTYTTTQTNLTNVVGCNTATLNVTITPGTTNGSVTTSICAGGSYTWPGPNGSGLTYTTAQTNLIFTNGCNVATLNLTVNPATTNGSVTTSICAGGSYTWPLPNGTGATYTTAQTNLTNTVGCNTATLNLTVTPNTTNGSVTTSICSGGSYTWPLPNGTGATYTTAQTNLTNTVGCNTATLNLTVTPTTTNGSVTTSICSGGSYTWPLPNGTGATYTTAQTNLTNTVGCNTATLNLTVTPSTTNGSVTTSICSGGSYTWPLPNGTGATYTTAQTNLTNTVGCNTATLNLTVTPTTTNGSVTTSACNSYTWAANGVTYTTSQTNLTHVVGCNTATLNLTINSSTTNGSATIVSSTPYTWPLPLGTGLTYSVGGTYTNTTTNASGCPNVATLNLTITTGTVNTFNIGTSCGATITNMAVTITATPVAGATSYTFRLTNTATNAVQNIVRPVNNFALSNYPGITLGTAYTIEVSVNNGPFGPPCMVVTPSPVSNIGAQCGTTLTSMTQYVYATYVANVTGYRFRVTNTSTSAVQTYDSALNRFFFNQLPNRSFGTTYLVEVSLKNSDGSYLPYSPGCNITTPAFPTTSLQASQCGVTATGNTQNFYATVVADATDYRFLLSRTVAPTYNVSVDRALNSFNLGMFAGLTAGTTYNVQVAVRIGGVWGPYGSVCTVTTPGTVRTSNIANAGFKAIAYPNPFAESFQFDVTTTADSTIQIRVYDMLGKQVDNRNVEVTDLESFEVGANYPSGVYNVIVSQGENTQTLRVIKR